MVDMPALLPEKRRPETELFRTLNDAYPSILGALCSAMSTALTRIPNLELPSGRLPDALAWTLAAAPTLDATEEEIRNAFLPPPPAHPIVEAVRHLIHQRRQFSGTATELFELLGPLGRASPRTLSHHLRNATLTLADAGIELRFHRLHQKTRVIELDAEPGGANSPNIPEFAPPDFQQPPQTPETEEVLQS